MVWRRSIASVAICSAVSNPKVTSVAPMSLSIVFGRSMTLTPCSACRRLPHRACPRRRSRSSRPARGARRSRRGAARRRRADGSCAGCRGSSCRSGSAGGLVRQLLGIALQRPAPAVAKADDLIPVQVDALADHRPDDRVEAGTVATAGEHAESHREKDIRPSPTAGRAAGVSELRSAPKGAVARGEEGERCDPGVAAVGSHVVDLSAVEKALAFQSSPCGSAVHGPT